MNASQETRSSLPRHFLTTAMLSCFAVAGWLCSYESSPKSQHATAATISRPQPSVTVPSRSNVVDLKPTTITESQPRYVTKNIEDIRKGDYVLAREEHGDKIALRKVVEVYRRTSHHLRHLTFEAEDGSTQTLQTTDEHPFWHAGREEWLDAGDFVAGDLVTSPTGRLQTLRATHRSEHPNGIPVFNFQVEDSHTYFVGACTNSSPLLVHNADHVYRVMSSAEFSGASVGKWADSAAPEIPGVKHTWGSVDDAKKWADYLKANGENSVITKIDVLKDTSQLKQWIHSGPIGRVIEVPLEFLGTATKVE